MRRAVVVAGAVALLAGCDGKSPASTAESSTTTLAAEPEASTTTVPTEATIRELCAADSSVEADLDGDGAPDRAFHRFVGDAYVGACLATGRVAMLPGSGMAEVFAVLDADADGRFEILYGGTSVCEAAAHLAVWVDDGLRQVVREDGTEFVLSDRGCPPPQPARAWGCRDRRLQLVSSVDQPDPSVRRWATETVVLEHDRIRSVSTRTVDRPSPPPSADDDHLVPEDLRPPPCATVDD